MNSEKMFGNENYIVSPQIVFGQGPWLKDEMIQKIPNFLEKWNTGTSFKTIERDRKILTLITCSYLNVYDPLDPKMNTMRVLNLLTKVKEMNIKINILLPDLKPIATLDFTDCDVDDFPNFHVVWKNDCHNRNRIPAYIDVVFRGVQI